MRETFYGEKYFRDEFPPIFITRLITTHHSTPPAAERHIYSSVNNNNNNSHNNIVQRIPFEEDENEEGTLGWCWSMSEGASSVVTAITSSSSLLDKHERGNSTETLIFRLHI